MPRRLLTFAIPLSIDVLELASYFPEFKYYAHASELPPEFLPDSIKEFAPEFIFSGISREKFYFLFFCNKTPDGFTRFSSDYTAQEIADLLQRVPAHLFKAIERSLLDTPLEIPRSREEKEDVFGTQFDVVISHPICKETNGRVRPFLPRYSPIMFFSEPWSPINDIKDDGLFFVDDPSPICGEDPKLFM